MVDTQKHITGSVLHYQQLYACVWPSFHSIVFSAEALELLYMKDEAGAVYQVVPFHDKLIVSVNSEVCHLFIRV